MRLLELKEDKSYQPPSIDVGDEVLVGKFKNRRAEVKGFTTDDNNQPVLKTSKGDQHLFKPRIAKLMPKDVNKQEIEEYSSTDTGIKTALKAKGYKFLGQGVDQSAYIEPGTGLVLKIFGTQKTQDFSIDQKMFFKWYDYCDKNKQNPYLTRFHGHESFMWKDKYRYLMIRTEPLQHTPGNIRSALINLASLARLPDNKKLIFAQLKKIHPDYYELLQEHLGDKGILLFANTIRTLEVIAEKSNYATDFYGDNIMQRVDGTPVINDPWQALK